MRRKHRKHNSIGMSIMLCLLELYAYDLEQADLSRVDDFSLWELSAVSITTLNRRRKAREKKLKAR